MVITTKMGEEMAKDMSALTTVIGHVSAYVDSMVIKCAVQLKLADVVHAHAHQYKEGGYSGITISQLAKSLPFNSANDQNLHRVMRYLVHMGFFTKSCNAQGQEMFGPNQASELLRSDSEKSVVPVIMSLLEEPVMSAWNCLSTALDGKQKGTPFEVKHGYPYWEMMAHQPDLNKTFNDGMAVYTGLIMPAVVMVCNGLFERLGSLVDVGGGTGMAAAYIATAFPHIKCSVLDLPHAVTATIEYTNVERIPGDMFVHIPHADALFLKNILHDWGDDECTKILKRCKEAIPKDGGVMIIVEVVIDEENDANHMLMKTKLTLDMHMMTWNGGMERNLKDWKLLLGNAGFEVSNVTPIPSGLSVIEARPLL